MPRFFPLLVSLSLLLAPAAHAQFAPSAAPNSVSDAPANDPLAPELKQLAAWYGRGFYDDMVHRADELIGDDDGKVVDGRLLFWRGKAFQRLGWWPEAINDLTRAQKMGVQGASGGGSVAEALAKIARLQALMPPLTDEIRDGNDVVFRVYYSSDNAFTRDIVASLPRAYRVSRAMFGTDVLATPVFIFDSYPQFRAFYTERSGKPPGSWVWAAGSLDGLYFSQQGPDGKTVAANDPDYARATIPHEFNHAMLHHLMGTTPLPRWFEEGLAQVAGGQVVAREEPYNDYSIARLFAANALVPPAQLEQDASFGAHTEVGAQMGREGAGLIAPSPYAQSYHMTRYLLSNLKRGDLPKFLNLVRDNNSFSRAFATQFGATVPQFYQSWYEDTARKVR